VNARMDASLAGVNGMGTSWAGAEPNPGA
jgi:hypothetical protein